MCPSSLSLSLSTHIFLFFIWACEFFPFVQRRTLAHHKKRAKAYVYNVYSSRPCLSRVEKNNNLPSPIPNPLHSIWLFTRTFLSHVFKMRRRCVLLTRQEYGWWGKLSGASARMCSKLILRANFWNCDFIQFFHSFQASFVDIAQPL